MNNNSILEILSRKTNNYTIAKPSMTKKLIVICFKPDRIKTNRAKILNNKLLVSLVHFVSKA